ncbi:catechol O-methyltransferase-like [Patiria miniata]|uniref:catechol O-methyltransferase n=1 Tax=Patiria miniata TaxID=46514 RepID=A0A914AZ03_PATMI|nr:catechol O-methyltransferase-like [Patiria miniata]
MATKSDNPQLSTINDEFLEDRVGRTKKMLAHLKERAAEISGDPAALLAATDKYCYEKDRRMMHVGDKKGDIVRKFIQELAPMTCLELGTYCGYSAVLMASVLPEGSRFITVEADETLAKEVAKEFIELAGAQVSQKVTIICKKSEDVIPTLRDDFSVDKLDFVFIDHWKGAYLRDLKLLESLSLLRKGTVVLADNIIFPGAPDYLEYVQKSENYQTEMIHSTVEYSDWEDALAKSVYLG